MFYIAEHHCPVMQNYLSIHWYKRSYFRVMSELSPSCFLIFAKLYPNDLFAWTRASKAVITCLTLLGDIPNVAAILDGYMSFEWSSFMARCRASTTSAVLDLERMASLGMSDSSVTRVITRSASSAIFGMGMNYLK